MSSTRGVRTLVGAALAASVILLGGCSSSGTTPGGSGASGGDNPVAAGSTSTHTSDSSGSDSTGGSSSSDTSDSSGSTGGDSSSNDSSTGGDSSGGLGGSDPGCQAALSAAQNALSDINPSDPSGTKKALQKVADDMHAAAGKAKAPGASAAINKLADDYAGLADALSSGKMPDENAISTDAAAMGTACAG